MRVFVEDLQAKGGLRADVTIEGATDSVWAMNSPELYSLFVQHRGWTPNDFEIWFADTCKRLFLP